MLVDTAMLHSWAAESHRASEHTQAGANHLSGAPPAAGMFSRFDLVEKYLIWRWTSFTRTSLGVNSLGPQFYSQGYSDNVSLAPTQNERRVELRSPAGRAILSQPYSTIFSHLMSRSVDEIEQMVGEGIT